MDRRIGATIADVTVVVASAMWRPLGHVPEFSGSSAWCGPTSAQSAQAFDLAETASETVWLAQGLYERRSTHMAMRSGTIYARTVLVFQGLHVSLD